MRAALTLSRLLIDIILSSTFGANGCNARQLVGSSMFVGLVFQRYDYQYGSNHPPKTTTLRKPGKPLESTEQIIHKNSLKTQNSVVVAQFSFSSNP